MYKKYHNWFEGINMDKVELFEKASCFYKLNYGKYMPSDKEAKILDLGCGMGHFLYFLKKENYLNFLGVDISQSQIDFCKSNISKNVSKQDILEFLKKDNEKYDLIVMNDILEHIPKRKVLSMLKNLKVRLNDNGKLIIKTINADNPFSSRSRYGDFTHIISYNQRSLHQILSEFNFKSVDFKNQKDSIDLVHFIFVSLRSLFYMLIRMGYMLDRGERIKILTPNIIVIVHN